MARGSHVRVIISILLVLGSPSGAGWAADKTGGCAAGKRIAAGREALGSLKCFAAAARNAGGLCPHSNQKCVHSPSTCSCVP